MKFHKVVGLGELQKLWVVEESAKVKLAQIHLKDPNGALAP